MRKKILFVIESLVAAGAERSLVTLLSLFDFSRYDVDLQLFRRGGELERFLPPEVHLLPPFDYSEFVTKSAKGQLWRPCFKKVFARFRFSVSLRIGPRRPMDVARKYWTAVKECIPINKEYYHAAIAYSQGIPTFYVVEKVQAEHKISWVNAIHQLSRRNHSFQAPYYHQVERVVCVSKPVEDAILKEFSFLESRTFVFRDRINASMIRLLAEERQAYINSTVPIILTVARLATIKGYDLVLGACKILKERAIPFKWYIIGKGPLKEQILSFIKNNGLQENMVLLGSFANPYPYFKAATLYVQTSRKEGFGLSIAEARILGKPVVTTEFDAVWQQMVQEKNGLVVPQDPIAVADAVERLLSDKNFYQSIVAYLAQETFDSEKDLSGFYDLLMAPIAQSV